MIVPYDDAYSAVTGSRDYISPAKRSCIQFSKRSSGTKTKAPYPPKEDKIEQERFAASLADMVEELSDYLQIIGNPPMEGAVCKCSLSLCFK